VRWGLESLTALPCVLVEASQVDDQPTIRRGRNVIHELEMKGLHFHYQKGRKGGQHGDGSLGLGVAVGK
jgi:hypothetical protein